MTLAHKKKYHDNFPGFSGYVAARAAPNFCTSLRDADIRMHRPSDRRTFLGDARATPSLLQNLNTRSGPAGWHGTSQHRRLQFLQLQVRT